MEVGQVSELWRHPVKSMRGNRLRSTPVTAQWGLPGDRGWVVRDEQDEEIRSAKKMPALLQFHASYVEEPVAESTPTVEITFPDGSVMRNDDDRINESLSDALGRKVRLWPRQPADRTEHYRRRPAVEADLRVQLGLGPHDPFPDFADMPDDVLVELGHYATPRGTYFDAMPVSLLSGTAMSSLQAAIPGAAIDSRRFRKNIVVDTGGAGAGHPEFDWVGRRLRIGDVTFEVIMRIARCRMVTLPQADLPLDRSILRSLARDNDAKLGVYLRVLTPGTISEGDPVILR